MPTKTTGFFFQVHGTLMLMHVPSTSNEENAFSTSRSCNNEHYYLLFHFRGDVIRMQPRQVLRSETVVHFLFDFGGITVCCVPCKLFPSADGIEDTTGDVEQRIARFPLLDGNLLPSPEQCLPHWTVRVGFLLPLPLSLSRSVSFRELFSRVDFLCRYIVGHLILINYSGFFFFV